MRLGLEGEVDIAIDQQRADEAGGRRKFTLGLDFGGNPQTFNHLGEMDAALPARRRIGVADGARREQRLFERLDGRDIRSWCSLFNPERK